MSKEHKNCLVLNADYMPICIINWQRAMVWHFRSINSGLSGIEVIEYHSNDYITTSNDIKPIPAVIRTKKYFNMNNLHVNFSRKNVFIRDNYTCQYCGMVLPVNKLTYDHVIPKSKWPHKGKTATCWTNIVTACFSCNYKKGNKTIQQANMSLKVMPYAPVKTKKYLHITQQLTNINQCVPKEWSMYLKSIVD